MDSVYFADINPDGSLGAWTGTTSLPIPLALSVVVTAHNRIYVVGGDQWDVGPYEDAVYYADVNPDGSLGSWTATTALP